MTIQFTYQGHLFTKKGGAPWSVPSDSVVEDFVNELEASFSLLHAGEYFPFPGLSFVNWLVFDWEIEDLKLTDPDVHQFDVVY